jgi:hypothetical protein
VNTVPPTIQEKLAGALRGVGRDEYGPSCRDHSIEIYKIYVEMADRISQRREKANTFFLTVNAALIAFLAKDAFGTATTPRRMVECLVPIAAIVLCYLWYRIIRSYKDLNSAKFKVIHELERHLPMRPYDAEWESVGRGKDPKLYLPFTRVEIVVPWLFVALHLALIAAYIPWATVVGSFR